MGTAFKASTIMGWNSSDNDSGNDDLDLGFDQLTVDPSAAPSFELIKRGPYPAIVTGGTMKSGKKEGSRYCVIEVTLLPESGHGGRKVWGNFTTANVNAKAVAIGRAQVTAAFRAAGVQSSNLADLVAAQEPMMVTIDIEKGTEGYSDKNTIKGFEPMGGASPATSAPGAGASKPSFMNRK